ncbi:MAG TPA: cobalamin-binding protein [Acidobacteriaceae bacterium]
MRICSFLPSATEILYALGAGQCVAGVTFECDFPAHARTKPVVVRTTLASGLTPQEIEDAVRAQVAAGGTLYVADQQMLEQLQPDLVITQDLCRVCAIGADDLAQVLAHLRPPPQVLSLEPHLLEDVLRSITLVGEAIGRAPEAQFLVDSLRERVERVKAARPLRRPRVLCLEWLAPLYQGGHWVPEMVHIAGGEPVLAMAGEKSVPLPWDQVREADPEVLVVMPCGFHLDETVAQYRAATFPGWWQQMAAVRAGQVYAVDGTAYFSRPGPRLVDGIEILQAILAGHGLDDLPAGSVLRLND